MQAKALGAMIAQSSQAAISLTLQILVARLLGIAEYGRFAILYGFVILAAGLVTGLIGDSLVVLERGRREIRAGLQGQLLLTTALLACAGAIGAGLSRFSSWPEALLFATMLAAFVVEEVVRRLLMAHMAFIRVSVADATGLAVALPIIAATAVADSLTLTVLFAAIAAGQVVALATGWFLLPKPERFLVGFSGADLAAVWRYGAWRGLQQLLRPGLFTSLRLLVLSAAGVTAVGLLEAARTYTSPLVLLIGGMSSFLFVQFADQRRAGTPATVREADRVVLSLLGVAVVLAVLALILRPWVSPLAFGVQVDPLAVTAWLAYGLSVAMVTPYGALGAVAGRQRAVFGIRLADTGLGLVGVLAMLAFGAPVATLPFGLAAASSLGGLGLRLLASRPAREAAIP